jgi:aminoglycoside phosphotransferase (APT) family kinase protein
MAVTGIDRPSNGPRDRQLAEMDDVEARRVLERACAVVALDSSGAELARLGEHAVFRLRSAMVARVARTDAYAADAEREVAVARWLGSAGFPAARAVNVDQPVRVDGSVVTFLESVSEVTEYATVAEVAEVVRRLHALDAPEKLELPRLRPFARVERRIAGGHLSSEDQTFLSKRMRSLRKDFDDLDFVLPVGAIHGDASIGNVLRDRRGEPVLVDLDGFAIGPREWDLTLTATYYDSFGWHSREEYETFVAVYGFDVMDWPGFETLRSIRELIMVTWLSQKARHDEEVAAELGRRIQDLRTGGSRRGWKPY